MKCNSFFYTIQPLFRRCASLNAELSESGVWSERRSAAAVNSRCVPALGSSRGSLRYAPLCTRTEHSLLAVVTLLTGAALTVMYCKFGA